MIIKGRVIRVRRYRRTVEEVQETATRGGCAPGGLGVTGCYITAGRTPRRADLLTLWVESIVLIPRFGGTGSAEKIEAETLTPRPGCGRRGIKTIINLYTTEFDLHYLHIFTITLVTAVVSIKR